MQPIVPQIVRDSVNNLVNKGERVDGRGFDQYREISLETGIISKAEGSARVKIGKTQIVVGAKPQIGTPFPDTPNVGVFMTNSELVPMGAPNFEPGPPDERSVELSRVTDRCIREGKVIDLEKLVIIPGEKVWMIFLDLHIIDYDGNLFDAAALGCMAALMNTRIPTATCEEDEVLIDYENMVPLPINNKAITCTFAKIGNEMVVDPSLEEEEIMGARLSVGINLSDNSICSLQKGGEKPLQLEEIKKTLIRAQEITKELSNYLPEA